METKTFKVPNIGCDGWVRTVKSEVSQLPGVQRVEADVDTKIVMVEWNPPASWERIANKLVEIDYPPATG